MAKVVPLHGGVPIKVGDATIGGRGERLDDGAG
jgi:hypothetical protein